MIGQASRRCRDRLRLQDKPIKEIVAFENKNQPDEWDLLLTRKPYWEDPAHYCLGFAIHP